MDKKTAEQLKQFALPKMRQVMNYGVSIGIAPTETILSVAFVLIDTALLAAELLPVEKERLGALGLGVHLEQFLAKLDVLGDREGRILH